VEILAASPYVGQGQPRMQHTVLRRTAAGGWVVRRRHVPLGQGAGRGRIADARIQRATANLLTAMTE